MPRSANGVAQALQMRLATRAGLKRAGVALACRPFCSCINQPPFWRRRGGGLGRPGGPPGEAFSTRGPFAGTTDQVRPQPPQCDHDHGRGMRSTYPRPTPSGGGLALTLHRSKMPASGRRSVKGIDRSRPPTEGSAKRFVRRSSKASPPYRSGFVVKIVGVATAQMRFAHPDNRVPAVSLPKRPALRQASAPDRSRTRPRDICNSRASSLSAPRGSWARAWTPGPPKRCSR
jgi:hypothetical protein